MGTAWRVFVLSCVFGRCMADLVAYDCSSTSANVTRVAMNDVAQCPEVRNTTREKIQVQVLQSRAQSLTHVRTCLVTILQVKFHCGMSDHSSIVRDGLTNEVYKLSVHECEELHRTGQFKLYGRHTIVAGKSNETYVHGLTTEGDVDSTGDCSWKYTQSTGQVTVKLTDYPARVEIEGNAIHLRGGTVCDFSDLSCFDADLGLTVWNPMQSKQCTRTSLEVLYQGEAQRLFAPDAISKENRTYVMVASYGYVFGLRVVKPYHYCGRTVWQTEHPQISLDLDPTGNFFFTEVMETKSEVNLLAYVNSKFLYVELSMAQKLDTIYTDALYKRCLIERDVLLNRLALARSNPDLVSSLLKSSPGFVARVVGSVLYIQQCTKVAVKIRRAEKCYTEIPVTFKNESYYISPFSRVLLPVGEEIPCSSIAPPVHNIEGLWTALNPHAVSVSAPEVLMPSQAQNLDFSPIQAISEGGLYTNEEVSEFQKTLMFPAQKAVINHILSSRVAGGTLGSQGYDMSNIFSVGDVKKIAKSALSEIWQGFSNFGTVTSGIFGIYLVFRIVKYILSVFVNAINIYATLGCGLTIFASLWNSLTLFVLRKTITRTRADMEEVRRIEENREIGETEPAPAPAHFPSAPENDMRKHTLRPTRETVHQMELEHDHQAPGGFPQRQQLYPLIIGP